MKIVCDNKIPFLRGVLEPYAEVVYLPGKETTPEVVRDADAIITRTRTICDESLLKGSSVKVIATATIGFDHIDTGWCEEHGIIWRNAPGCNSWSVKQYMSSVLVSLSRMRSFDLEGKTLGVVGVGNVGSKVAQAASALGMKVLLNDPPRERREGSGGFVSLDEILRRSDIITLHVPLSREGEDATWHLFDAERIGKMNPSQILVNSSRGPVVDNAALKQALKARAIAGGGYVYYMMLSLVMSHPQDAREYLLMTTKWAIGLAAGISLVAAAEQILYRREGSGGAGCPGAAVPERTAAPSAAPEKAAAASGPEGREAP